MMNGKDQMPVNKQKKSSDSKISPVKKDRPRRRTRKDDNARKRILKAARQTFSLHSFRAATTRMIAKEAGVDHPLIHYHFGSKEMLFEAIAAEMYEEFSQAHLSCFDEIRFLPPQEGFPIYLDRLLDYCLKNPEQLQLIMLNMTHIGRLEEIPGYQYILMHMEKVRKTLSENIKLRGPEAEIKRFIHCFHILMISFIGSKTCQAQFLKMDSESDAYRQWLKDSLLVLFLPLLEELIFPDKRDGRSSRRDSKPSKISGREPVTPKKAKPWHKRKN